MQNSRLPVEVCEHIIDLSWTSSRCNLGLERARDRSRTLLSCTLICTQLEPRSRISLYKTVVLRTSRQAGLFARTLRDAPRLGTLVHEFVIDSRERHIPFAQGLFLRYLPNVRYIFLNVDWSLYPPQYHSLIPHFDIHDLVIDHQLKAEDLCLIWSLPQLQYCQFWADMEKAQRAKTLALMRWREGTEFCPSLKELHLRVDPNEFESCIPRCALGNSIEELYLWWCKSEKSTAPVGLNDIISGCTSLKHITYTIWFRENTDHKFGAEFLFLLNALASHAPICTIKLRFFFNTKNMLGLDTVEQLLASLSEGVLITLFQSRSLTLVFTGGSDVSEIPRSFREMIPGHTSFLNNELVVQIDRVIIKLLTLKHRTPERVPDHRRHASRHNSISDSTGPLRDIHAPKHMDRIINALKKSAKKIDALLKENYFVLLLRSQYPKDRSIMELLPRQNEHWKLLRSGVMNILELLEEFQRSGDNDIVIFLQRRGALVRYHGVTPFGHVSFELSRA